MKEYKKYLFQKKKNSFTVRFHNTYTNLDETLYLK